MPPMAVMISYWLVATDLLMQLMLLLVLVLPPIEQNYVDDVISSRTRVIRLSVCLPLFSRQWEQKNLIYVAAAFLLDTIPAM